MNSVVRYLLCLALVSLAGCGGGSEPKLDLPSGAVAYARVPATSVGSASADYVVGAQDKLAINVFGERDLSTDNGQIDASGFIMLPLIGKVQVVGKTVDQLSSELQGRLAKYVVNPRVSIIVLNAVSQRVTVEGSVNQAGVYGITGRTTLLEIMAMARGASNNSDPKRVAIFRTINGQRMGALFDATEIENGTEQDPVVMAGDVVVVGHSARRQAWHDFLGTVPLLGFFVPLATAL